MIEFKNVISVCNSQRLLDGMCFKLTNGKIYGICGEAALVHEIALHLAGAKIPADGSVQINGFDLCREADRARSFLGFVPKGSSTYLDITPLEYLLFCADARQMDYEQAIRRIGETLAFVGLSHKRNSLVKYLSEYEKKCLTLAQSLLGNAEILVFDEPFEELSSQEAERFSVLIEDTAREKTLILCASKPQYFKKLCTNLYRATANKLLDMEEYTEGGADNI